VSADREALLIDWLNELVYRGEVDKCVFADVHVDRIDEHGLDATVYGRQPRSPRTAVKAATWHATCVRSQEDGSKPRSCSTFEWSCSTDERTRRQVNRSPRKGCSAMAGIQSFERIGEGLYEANRTTREDMRVPARIVADDALLTQIGTTAVSSSS